ncbi:MAG: hypothetical protein ACI4HI_14000 [Lachnospiraceae bacterium]
MKKRRMKQMGALLLSLLLFLAAMPVGSVSAATTAKKLTKEDFECTKIVCSTRYEVLDYQWVSKYYAKTKQPFRCSASTDGTCSKIIKTKRGITLNSTADQVLEAYGTAKKQNYVAGEKFHSYMEQNNLGFNITKQNTYYFQYTLKQGKNEYKMRFYIDKSDEKVSDIIFITNLSSLTFAKKTKSVNVSVKLPKGKKMITKKIAGKTVNILPHGTKLVLTPKQKNQYFQTDLQQFDSYGDKISDMYKFEKITAKTKVYDIDQMVKESRVFDPKKKYRTEVTTKPKTVNPKKPGKYVYFAIRTDIPNQSTYGPDILYFRFQ